MLEKPNILLLMADQLAPQFLPCYGHRIVNAPALTKLAEDSVVFDAAYCNSPLCAPSRFSMMSGRLPSKISAWDNAAEFSAEVPTFAHYLAAEGYRTCLSGKMHFVGPDQLHGFAERLTTDVYPADFTWHPEWRQPDARLDWYHTIDVVRNAGHCKRSMYLDYDDEVVFAAKRYLYDQARDGNTTPFLLTVSLIQPHDPYLCRPEKWALYRDDDIDLPTTPFDTVPEDPHSKRLRHAYGASDFEVDDTTLRNARRAYYGSISDIDDKVGDLLSTLADAGLQDNTVVIFTSDHGDMLGERGMWFKMSFFEYSARVPLLIHAPQLFPPRRVTAAVSLVDLLPTLVELGRAGSPGSYATSIEGQSLLPHVMGGTGHDAVTGEYFGEGSTSPQFMIRRGSHKFICATGDPTLYFDLATDPEERHNLAGDPTKCTDVTALQAEINSRYDIDALSEAVLESQDRRRFLKSVMRAQDISWDYAPDSNARTAYVRNTLPIYQLEKRARFPEI